MHIGGFYSFLQLPFVTASEEHLRLTLISAQYFKFLHSSCRSLCLRWLLPLSLSRSTGTCLHDIRAVQSTYRDDLRCPLLSEVLDLSRIELTLICFVPGSFTSHSSCLFLILEVLMVLRLLKHHLGYE